MHPIRAVVLLAPWIVVACAGRITSAGSSDAGAPEDEGQPVVTPPIAEGGGLAPSSPGGGASSSSSSSSGGGPTCVPQTCVTLGATCGANDDGCGGVLHCGNCTPPDYCGGGTHSHCIGAGTVAVDSGLCVSTTCQSAGANCGAIGDGCGGVIQCGTCASPQYCGGGGYSQCGGTQPTPVDAGICVPMTCQALGVSCGPNGDGCGGIVQCGTCVQPQFCGGGGYGQCGGPGPDPTDAGIPCVPSTCASAGETCGDYGDGCGGVMHCGACTPNDASADGPG